MLTTATLENSQPSTRRPHPPPVIEETGITTEDAEAVHVAWFKGTTEQLFREVQLAGVFEAAAASLRSGWG
jgi:hypothetical protein